MAAANVSRTTVVGVFQDHFQADQAVSDLRQAGFKDDQIGIVGRNKGDTASAETTEDAGSHAGTGALTGALAGLGVGGLVGLGVISGVIPVLGPIIAGGTMAAILANAAGGAAIGTLAGALVGSGIPEDEANYYHSEFESGRTIVTVHAGSRYDEASAILRRHGAYDMHTRAGSASAMAASPAATMGSSTTSTGHYPTGSHTTTGAEHHIPVREEEMDVQKHTEKAGEVHVRKEVVTEHKTMDVPVRHEEIIIERHAVSGEHHTASGPMGSENQEIRVPVMEEHVTVEKHPVVKEEVTIRKQGVTETKRVGADIRKEQVHVDRTGDAPIHDRGEK